MNRYFISTSASPHAHAQDARADDPSNENPKPASMGMAFKWKKALAVTELVSESAVLNHHLEDEIAEAHKQMGAMETGTGNYEDQGDMAMYTKENLIRRNRLKRRPELVSGIKTFWHLLNPIKTLHGSPSINQDNFSESQP